MRAIKLLILALMSASILAGVGLLPDRLCFEGGEKYTFYCGTSSSDCKIVVADQNAEIQKLLLKEVCGESCRYDSLDLESFLKRYGGEVVFVEELSDSVNYYCKADLPYSVILRGKEINLHVCVRSEFTVAGSPIIFGGY